MAGLGPKQDGGTGDFTPINPVITPINNAQYVPSTWSAGDTVTSAKLNKIEQGILNAGGALTINIIENPEDSTIPMLDKTWQEIYDGNYYFITLKQEASSMKYKSNGEILEVGMEQAGGPYYITAMAGQVFTTDTPNGYPILAPTEISDDPSDDTTVIEQG